MATFSLWHLKSLSYAPQECRDLFVSIQKALGEVEGEIIRALAKVQSTEFIIVVTYVGPMNKLFSLPNGL
jgi:hypothetical protein